MTSITATIQTKADSSWLQRTATFTVILMAVLLWGYLIGAYLQMRVALHQSPPSQNELRLLVPGLSDQAQSPAEFSNQGINGARGVSVEPTWDEIAGMVDEHPRFLPRNRQFKARIQNDPLFKRNNSL